MALGLEAVLEGEVVFDDAIVNHDQRAVAIAVRVGVLFGGAPVRGPARMSYAESAFERVLADHFFQVAQLTLGAANGELVVVAIDGQAGGIVPAVFQALEAFQDDGDRFMRADVADNSAHASLYRLGPPNPPAP